VLVPIGKRAMELSMKDPITFSSYPDNVLYLCFLPEMSGQEENSLINSSNNFLALIFPMGEEFSEKVIMSQGIARRIERRKSKVVLFDDEMKKFPHHSFSKLIEFREHLIFLLHMAFVQKESLFLGRDATGMSFAKIKYDPYATLESVRDSPWYIPGKEEVFSFSKFNVGNKVEPDINEMFIVTFKD
jgi:hypothetical protein